MKLFLLLMVTVFASKNENGAENDPKNKENPILVKIEEDEYAKVNKQSEYIGVSYDRKASKWCARRWSTKEKRQFSNGYYDDEERTAHASDTLARKLMNNSEYKLKFNFPDDYIEVYPEKATTSKYIGVSYNKNESKWRAQRWCKNENKNAYNGCYDDKETAARASDTLARKMMKNGKQNHKLNFPDDHTEVYPEAKNIGSKFIGVFYSKNSSKWCAARWNKNENKNAYNGYYDDKEAAARASDTLARKLMDNNDKQKLKLNFPDDYTEIYSENPKKKRKRPYDFLEHPQNK